jgi:hypothetical protein
MFVIWECEFKKLLLDEPKINDFLNEHSRIKYNAFIIPRDSVYGGHVETFKLYHKIGTNEKIEYLDFTSLLNLSLCE